MQVALGKSDPLGKRPQGENVLRFLRWNVLAADRGVQI